MERYLHAFILKTLFKLYFTLFLISFLIRHCLSSNRHITLQFLQLDNVAEAWIQYSIWVFSWDLCMFKKTFASIEIFWTIQPIILFIWSIINLSAHITPGKSYGISTLKQYSLQFFFLYLEVRKILFAS